MLEELLTKEEGKTIEFQENTKSLPKIIQTIVALANTAGGALVIGIKDKTKEVIGLSNILEEEKRIANAIADSVFPLIIPSLQLHTWRDRDLLLISVPHSFGPYHIKSKGIDGCAATNRSLKSAHNYLREGKVVDLRSDSKAAITAYALSFYKAYLPST